MVHQKKGGTLRGLRIKREREEYICRYFYPPQASKNKILVTLSSCHFYQIFVPPVAIVVPHRRVTHHLCFAMLSCRSSPLSCRMLPCCPSSCRMSPPLCHPSPLSCHPSLCCPLMSSSRPSSCRPSPSSCCLVVPPVVIVVSPVALLPLPSSCRPSPCRPVLSLCRRCLVIHCHRQAARCRHCAVSYSPSPSLCCPSPC